jgi:hypothetical protein
VSRDGGDTWEEVGKNIPGVDHESYVSGLEASWFDAGTAYAALDRHRNNDLKPYVFKTTDYGKTWTNVTGDLPVLGNVNSIRQDPVNKNLLYAPTELGFFVSLNDGKNWHKFMPNLPTGRTDEVLVHPRENDLILATHSRSVWIMDDVSALQNMTDEQLAKDAALFPTRDAVAWKQDRRIGTEIPGDKWWQGENAPRGTAIAYAKAGGDAKVTITDTATGTEFRTQSATAAGSQPLAVGSLQHPDRDAWWRSWRRWRWRRLRRRLPGAAAAWPTPGIWKVSVSVAGKEIGSQTFKVMRTSGLMRALVGQRQKAEGRNKVRNKGRSEVERFAAAASAFCQEPARGARRNRRTRLVFEKRAFPAPSLSPRESLSLSPSSFYLAVSPGAISNTSMLCGSSSCFSTAGVPVSAPNVPQCIGTT